MGWKSQKNPGDTYRSFRGGFAKWGSRLIICAGGIVILGWLLHIRICVTLLPGLVAMKVNTACCFIAAGAKRLGRNRMIGIATEPDPENNVGANTFAKAFSA